MNPTNTELKNALSQFASGVTVITYSSKDKYSGLTVSSFAALSLDPPQILFCIQKNVSSHDKIKENGYFVVNILERSQEDLSNSFAKSSIDKHELITKNGFTKNKTNCPILDNNLAFLECEVVKYYDGGDHSIVIGKVLSSGLKEDKKPLIYYNRKYQSI